MDLQLVCKGMRRDVCMLSCIAFRYMYMNSQCQVISHLHVMTYLFDLQNALNS